jgi:hypothetical protein
MDERRGPQGRRGFSDVSRITFTPIRRGGVDPNEVRLHLESIAKEMQRYEAQVRDLEDQLAAALRQPTPLPVPVKPEELTEAELVERVGGKTAEILRNAHEEAGRVLAEAQQRSSDQLIEAQERASILISEAENTAHALERDAREAAERLVASGKLNGEALIAHAQEQARSIVELGKEARRQVLNDMAVKRKALHMQIEQLRTARDTIATFILGVRDQMDGVLGNIQGSDEAAKIAALEALRRAVPIQDLTEEEALANATLQPSRLERSAQSSGETQIADPPTQGTPKVRARKAVEVSTNSVPPAAPAPALGEAEQFIEEGEVIDADVVNDIFSRLRQATLEERGATAVVAKRIVERSVPTTEIEELFARRDAALEPALAMLTRKVKRALQDDQNVMLDRLRDVRGMIVDELEEERLQRARYADAAYEALFEAAQSGLQFVLDETGIGDGITSSVVIQECATDLAVTIVVALRKRLLSESAGDGAERANTVYKEWRGARVERLCADAARRAFNAGIVAGSQSRNLHFRVAPSDAPCDDCSNNEAHGVVRAGQPFHSGSAFPPVHAGCACLVLP